MSLVTTIRKSLVPIHREGYPFIAIAVAIALGLMAVSTFLGMIAVGLAIWTALFFRDPPRVTPVREGLVVAPADGRISQVGLAKPPRELDLSDDPLLRISIFMNVFNVHVNRVPCDGLIEKAAYTPGKFFNASLDKASVHNERMAVAMRTTGGERVLFVQIAGLVARRIVCYLTGGESVRAGERFGLIRFGSRVDVYLPVDSEVNVTVGQKTVAGETVLARLPVPRTGEAAASGVARTAQEVPVGR